MNYQIIDVGDKLYKVIRIIRDKSKWDLELLRQFWNCSHTFKKEGVIYFVREIEDVEYEALS